MHRLLIIIAFALGACAHTGMGPTAVEGGVYYGVGEASGMTQAIAVAQNRARADVVRQVRSHSDFAATTLTGVRIVRIWREGRTWYAQAIYRDRR